MCSTRHKISLPSFISVYILKNNAKSCKKRSWKEMLPKSVGSHSILFNCRFLWQIWWHNTLSKGVFTNMSKFWSWDKKFSNCLWIATLKFMLKISRFYTKTYLLFPDFDRRYRFQVNSISNPNYKLRCQCNIRATLMNLYKVYIVATDF